MPDLSACRFPDLGSPHAQALREAVAFILDRYEPLGVLACGSIVRGNPDPTSDLDLYVIQAAPWRQRVQKRFAGVPCEIFINSPTSAGHYLADETWRPQSAHMLATGFPVLEDDPVVAELRARARKVIDAPKPLGEPEATCERYHGALLLEDAVDVLPRDPDAASLLAVEAVQHAARLRFRQAALFVPRHKDLLTELATLDRDLAGEVRRFLALSDASSRVAHARVIGERVFGAGGFFEWESPRDPFPEAGKSERP